MEEQIVNLTVFLIKETIDKFEDCIKVSGMKPASRLKNQFGLDGVIFTCDSNKKTPRWKTYLDELSEEKLDISDNMSNKAIMLVNVANRIMAITFGYGRSFLKEECIVRNFGFKVALNTINSNKMRSVNAATIEDMVVTTQRQASYSTSQDEFGLNVTNDIMRGITGEPYDVAIGNHISGKDSLVVAVYMNLSELKEKLELYLSAYKSEQYKKIGFEWVDNIAEVRDSLLIDELNFELSNAIEKRNIEQLHISPPETTDWDKIIGFCYSGCGNNYDNPDDFTLDLDLSEFIGKIRPKTNIYQKIHRDKLYAINIDGAVVQICNIYSALVFQIMYLSRNYILCAGTWYLVDTPFFDLVNNYIRNNIKISDINLPDCPFDFDEGRYNELASEGSDNICIMDKRMVSVAGGPKKIEACDLFTKDKKFVHVKNKGQSAQLSHLFSQGKVSAECFISDENFRKQVSEISIEKFGSPVFDYTHKPTSNEFEVVYAIIDESDSNLEKKLPFFSKVNLMLTAQELDRMHFDCSVTLIKKAKQNNPES